MVKDLGSSNGTRVNGERQTSAVLLKNGDEVRTGAVIFRFDEEVLEHQSEETREFEELAGANKTAEPTTSETGPTPAQRPRPAAENSGAGTPPRERPRPPAPKPPAPAPAEKPKKVDPMVGTVEGDYEIQDLLGKGAVGAVYKARQISTGRTVAYKILHSEVSDNNTAVQRFIREAKTGAQLRHPTITTVYDLGKAEKHLYLAMEYVDGSNLHDIVVKDGVLDQKQAAIMFYALADGLQHAHQAKIVHRDLKPANIMVTKDSKPKLTDLGLAKSLDSSEVQVTAMGTLLGTPGYMAPEQAQGSPDIDSRVDIYSLGATLYYAVTRHHPFSGKSMLDIIKRSITEDPVNPIVHNSNLSLDFVRVIQKAMKRDLAGRYQTCQELCDDMVKFL
jgi:serine/threonine protein kinase